MVRNFKIDDTTLDRLYMMWGRLGWDNTIGIYDKDVDVENLIVETTHIARYDGRLMAILMTWVKDFGDFIDKDKLLKLSDKADSAVLGAVLDIAMQYGGPGDFTTIMESCRPADPPEILFKGLEDIHFFMEEQKKYPKKEFLKWGLYTATFFFYTDCLYRREWILEHNENLRKRCEINKQSRRVA